MYQGKLVFAQMMQHLPLSTFRRCVTRYQGERKVKSSPGPSLFFAVDDGRAITEGIF